MRSSWLSAVAGSGKTKFISDCICSLHDKRLRDSNDDRSSGSRDCDPSNYGTGVHHVALSCQNTKDKTLCIGFSRATIKGMCRAVVSNLPRLQGVSFCTVHALAACITGFSVNNSIAPGKIALDLLWKKCYVDDAAVAIAEFADLFCNLKVLESELSSVGAGKFNTDTHRNLLLHLNCAEQQLKVKHGIVSYNDLLRLATSHLCTSLFRDLPRHILVDEAQDLTELQWSLIEKVFQESLSIYPDATITVVGDPNQIIYGFQGSSMAIWQERRLWWGELGVKKEFAQSTKCYRCGQAILEVVNQIYTPQHNHVFKESWVELLCAGNLTNEQCAMQVARGVTIILEKYGAKPEDVLILVKRRGVLLQSLLEQLRSHNIAASGLSYSVNDDLECLLPFFRIIEDCNDDFAFDLLQVTHNSSEMYRRIRQRSGSVMSVIEECYHDLAQIIANLCDAKNDLGRFINILAGYARINENVRVKESILDLAATYCAERVGHTADFVEYCKQQQSTCAAPIEGCVRVLTIHGAKGMQAKYVVVADGHENPHRMYSSCARASCRDDGEDQKVDDALQASRNLLYVALTRAERGVLMCGAGKVAADSFSDMVGRALHALGAKESVGDLGACLRWERG